MESLSCPRLPLPRPLLRTNGSAPSAVLASNSSAPPSCGFRAHSLPPSAQALSLPPSHALASPFAEPLLGPALASARPSASPCPVRHPRAHRPAAHRFAQGGAEAAASPDACAPAPAPRAQGAEVSAGAKWGKRWGVAAGAGPTRMEMWRGGAGEGRGRAESAREERAGEIERGGRGGRREGGERWERRERRGASERGWSGHDGSMNGESRWIGSDQRSGSSRSRDVASYGSWSGDDREISRRRSPPVAGESQPLQSRATVVAAAVAEPVAEPVAYEPQLGDRVIGVVTGVAGDGGLDIDIGARLLARVPARDAVALCALTAAGGGGTEDYDWLVRGGIGKEDRGVMDTEPEGMGVIAGLGDKLSFLL
ncbi:unnamed protein product [Closterium sp. NIES-54]